MTTHDGLVLVASEAGVSDLGGREIAEKGQLGPGQMLAVDLQARSVLRDAEIKSRVASRRPYGRWLREQRLRLPHVPAPRRELRRRGAPSAPDGLRLYGGGRRGDPAPHGPARPRTGLLDGRRRPAGRPVGQAAHPLRLLQGALRAGHQSADRPAAGTSRHVAGHAGRPAWQRARRLPRTRARGQARLAAARRDPARGTGRIRGSKSPACRRCSPSPAGPGGCATPSNGSATTSSRRCAAAPRSSSSATGSASRAWS